MAWNVTANVDEFDEAAEWFGDKIPIPADKLDSLSAEDRRKAFRIAGVTELEVVQTVHGSIDDAIRTGKPFDQWKREVKKELNGRWAPDGWLLETVFRTNVQTAYNTGRYEQLFDPDVTAVRPFMVFDAVDDTKTTKTCKDRDGVVKGHDDPYIQDNWPPLHHRCRSGWRSLRRSQADAAGGPTPSASDPATKPADGFGLSPPRRGDPEPKSGRFGPDLWQAYGERRANILDHERLDRLTREQDL